MSALPSGGSSGFARWSSQLACMALGLAGFLLVFLRCSVGTLPVSCTFAFIEARDTLSGESSKNAWVLV